MLYIINFLFYRAACSNVFVLP